MIHPSVPHDEQQRMNAVRRYGILDTPAEASFDRITRLAAELLEVPISTITLIDEDRQWFKSVYGMDARENSRALSFCGHAILGTDLMVVEDARTDRRFVDNPFVLAEPHIRFYAGAPIKSADGFNLGTLCAIDRQPREMTARQRRILRDLAGMVQESLELRVAARQREQQLAAIMSVGSGVLVSDPATKNNPAIFVNSAFCEITGYQPEEILGRNCRMLQGPETDQRTVQKIRDALAERRPFHGEILNYRKDGTPFWNELTITPVFDQTGELANFVAVQTDVTERIWASRKLRESFDKLKELESLRDGLSNMIIHDLRSPLTGVLGFLELLKMTTGGKLDEKDQEYLQAAGMSAARIEEMITQLLDVSRLEEGVMPVACIACDLRDVLQDAISSVQLLEGKDRLDLQLPTEPVQLRCDPDLTRRVVLNLVSNALKFTPPGRQARVTLLHDEQHRALISVSDDGPGIAPEYQQKIFEKFGQVESKRVVHSTGLGLTFCKLAVEAQGGRIWVESQLGKGSTFTFSIPMQME